MTEQNEIVIYKPNFESQIEVRVEKDTVWLTQAQIAELFGVGQPAISKHIKNIYSSGELPVEGTYSILEYMGNDGKQSYQTKYYNLDMILSIGYRVTSKVATAFRQWANTVLKDYLLRGYAMNERLLMMKEEIDYKLAKHELILQEHQKQIDFFVKAELAPHQGVFMDGQIYDAFEFATRLIKSAKKSITLIDNYVDETVLTLLDKREDTVSAIIYTQQISRQLRLDVDRHNSQYPPIEISVFRRSHDRFLCIDDTVYHVGASIKDFGKKLGAISLLCAPKHQFFILTAKK